MNLQFVANSRAFNLLSSNQYSSSQYVKPLIPSGQCASSITVMNSTSSDPGSLRQALIDVCSGGTIDFDASLSDGLINLIPGGQLNINKEVTIDGSSLPQPIRVSGNGTSRVFEIQSSAIVNINHIRVISGTRDAGQSCHINCGGGIYVASGGQLTLENSIVEDNAAYTGGGLYNNGGTVVLINNIFSNNWAVRSGGGFSQWRGTSSINNTTFAGNRAGKYGGAIYQLNLADEMNITRSAFVNNSASQNGGGIQNFDVMNIDTSTFSGNEANYGGGIANSTGGILTVHNSTFSDNTGTFFGGGIFNQQTLYLRNTIIANSISGGDCYSHPAPADDYYNIIEDDTCSPHFSGDPNLGPLDNYGGSTQTYSLLSDSIAIDKGVNFYCLETDQRGMGRPIDGDEDSTSTCDIGAYEYVPPVDETKWVYLPLIIASP